MDPISLEPEERKILCRLRLCHSQSLACEDCERVIHHMRPSEPPKAIDFV